MKYSEKSKNTINSQIGEKDSSKVYYPYLSDLLSP